MTDPAPTQLSSTSLMGRAHWAIIGLSAVILSNVLAVGALLSQEALLVSARNGQSVTAEAAKANDAMIDAINSFHVIAYIVAAILYLRWFYPAYGRLAAIGSGRSNKTASAAGWDWAIPFVNLVRPYKNVSELWLRSAEGNVNPELDSATPAPTMVGIWWLAYIGSSLGSRAVSTYSTTHTSTIADLIAVSDLWLVVNIAQGIAGVLAATVVWRIKFFQSSAVAMPPLPGVAVDATPGPGQPAL